MLLSIPALLTAPTVSVAVISRIFISLKDPGRIQCSTVTSALDNDQELGRGTSAADGIGTGT